MSKKKRQSLSYLNRSFLVFALSLAFFALIVILGFTYFMNDRTMRAETERYKRIADRVEDQLNGVFDDMNYMSIYVSLAPLTRELPSMQAKSVKGIADFYDALLPFGVPLSKAKQRISLMSDAPAFYALGYPTDKKYVESVLATADYAQWYRELSGRQLVYLPPRPDQWSREASYYPFACLRSIRDLNNMRPIGLVSVELPAETLADILRPNADETMCLLDAKGREISLREEAGGRDFGALLETMTAAGHGGESTGSLQSLVERSPLTGGAALCFLRPLKNTDWSLLVHVREQDILGTVRFQLALFVAAMVLLSLLLMPFGYALMRRAAKPLRQLKQQAERVNADNLTIQLDLPLEQDEVAQINEALTRMIERLKLSAEENAVMHARELKASFLALQAQINPHFLNNTLAIMSGNAREIGSEALALSLNRLAHMMRYVTQSTPRTVCLREELNHLEDYLALMKLRFEDQLIYEVIWQDQADLERIWVPRMSLQPILENAFSHGFAHVLPPWHIRLKITVVENEWRICVYNNGVGRSREEILKLTAKIEAFLDEPGKGLDNLRIGGMGLVSSLSRFGHLYGRDFSFDIRSSEQASGFTLELKGVLTHASLNR